MDQEHYQVELAVLLAEWRRRQAQLILRCWKLLTPAERRVMCRAILRCDESLAAPGRGKGAALRECFETIKPLTERASTRAKARQIAVFRRAGHRRARIRWPRHGDGARRVWCLARVLANRPTPTRTDRSVTRITGTAVTCVRACT